MPHDIELSEKTKQSKTKQKSNDNVNNGGGRQNNKYAKAVTPEIISPLWL